MSCQWMFLIEVTEFRVNSGVYRSVHDENMCNMHDLVSFSRKSHVCSSYLWRYLTAIWNYAVYSKNGVQSSLIAVISKRQCL
jgi:hypothetical protein